jgi:hypothetical protein
MQWTMRIWRYLLALVVALAAAFAVAQPALAITYRALTPQRPNRYVTLTHGLLGAQVTFGRQQAVLAWGLKLNAATYGAAIGPQTEDGDLYCNGARIKSYHDHHVVPATYLIHSSFGPLTTKCRYQLHIRQTFPIRKGDRLGDRIIWTDFFFYIALV